MEKHEGKCIEKRDKAIAARKAYRQKCSARMKKAVDWAQDNPAIQILLDCGYREEARLLCDNWAQGNLWHGDDVQGWEEVLDAMTQKKRR